MSQSRIRNGGHGHGINDEQSKDWMQELEMDAQNFQAVLQRLDEVCQRSLFSLGKGDTVGAGLRIAEIREGITLLCKLGGVRIDQSRISN
jgi:hypothetical protein